MTIKKLGIKKIVIIFTIYIGFVLTMLTASVHRITVEDLNLVEVNDILFTAVEEWDGQIEKSVAVARKYGIDIVVFTKEGTIVARSDSMEQITLDDAMRRRDTIVDIVINGQSEGKLVINNESQRKLESTKRDCIILISIAIGTMVLFAAGYFLYISKHIIKPFHKMKEFANHVATGNLDIPVPMNKDNLFGAFSESFDLMRIELAEAREKERQANESKKELVASLSHDIKTPLSSNKSLAELLSVQIKEAKQKERIESIFRKTSQIELLTNNLFHSTLEELNALKVEVTEEASTFLEECIAYADYRHKIIDFHLPECLIICDKLRISQVFDNIIANSYKYADTMIQIRGEVIEKNLHIYIRDHGKGVNKEELPLLTTKFYRGQNAEGKSGSGIGLYMSDYFMRKMGGALSISSTNEGFIVELQLALS